MKDCLCGWWHGVGSGRFSSRARFKVGGTIVLGILALLPISGLAQVPATASPAISAPSSLGTNFAVVSRGPNSRIWRRALPIATNQQGRITYRTNSYTELGTGLCRWTGTNWVDSSESIAITPTGGAATNGQWHVGFAGNINSAALETLAPDGTDLKTRIMGLSYFDRSTGSNVLFAELQDAKGWLVRSNQVAYSNAFSGTRASVRYIYRRSSFEQDIVIESPPPAPESFGLSAATTSLQVWTEFLNNPSPKLTPTASGTDLALDFGNVHIGAGRAFFIGNASNSVPVKKKWLTIQGRTFLVEQVPYSSIAARLQNLPRSAVSGGTGGSARLKSRYQSFPKELPPAPALAKRNDSALELAAETPTREEGLVMDYIALNSDQTDFTFQGDTTYYIDGLVNLWGITTFEDGTVLKFADGSPGDGGIDGPFDVGLYVAQSYPFCPLVSPMSPYHMAVFTSVDDNTVGEAIGSGSPVTASANCYLQVPSSGNSWAIRNIRFAYAYIGMYAGDNTQVWDSQFVNCHYAMSTASVGSGGAPNQCDFHNVLFGGCNASFDLEGEDLTLTFENVTSDSPSLIANWYQYYTVDLTNTIFTDGNVVNNWQFNYDSSDVVNPTGSIFQSAGAGNYYLANGSPYRGAGTTNVSPQMLAELRQTTTYPPSNLDGTLTFNTTLTPVVPRNTGAPDIGYHYWPIDYLSACAVSNATLTLTNGVVLGYYLNYGLWAQNNSWIVSQGSPSAKNRLVYYNLVQEQPIMLGGSPGPWFSQPLNSYHNNWTQNPSAYLRFTTIDAPQSAMYALYTGGNSQMNSLTLRDCEIYGSGSCWFGDISMNTPVFTFQNNLFWETGINASYDADKITLYNNLFYGTANESVTESDWGSGSVTNHDNVFDGLNAVSLDGANGHNAFVGMNANNLSPTPGSSDIVLPGFNWQAGPLGNFYQATNSPFINRGSRSAAAAGLYHYTVLTNQSIEDGATNVALGYHYIAVDGNGNPLDANGDGIPDYLEDANGNGLVDNNEMDWMTHYPTLIGPAIQVYTPLKLQ